MAMITLNDAALRIAAADRWMDLMASKPVLSERKKVWSAAGTLTISVHNGKDKHSHFISVTQDYMVDQSEIDLALKKIAPAE